MKWSEMKGILQHKYSNLTNLFFKLFLYLKQ